MDVVAGYKTGGVIGGDIMIDGRPKDEATWKKISGYAEQNDILNPYLTVIETVMFTAACRLPHHVNKQERVNEVLDLMDLHDYANFVVGRELEGEGLSKHVRKRLTIAVQLVIRPCILFLDEPTTVKKLRVSFVHEHCSMAHSIVFTSPFLLFTGSWQQRCCDGHWSHSTRYRCHGYYHFGDNSSAVKAHLGHL